MSVRVIVFDFGNVIGFFDRRRAAQQLAAHGPPGVSLDDLMRFIFFTDLEPAFERAQCLFELADMISLNGLPSQARAYVVSLTVPGPHSNHLVQIGLGAFQVTAHALRHRQVVTKADVVG